MVLRTNMSSLNSCRHLKKNDKSSSKNLEKLASGYRINTAADDASGTGISEKMRAQITALTTVTEGVEDGVNLVRTADGYLEEVQNILCRMTELSMKSANGVLEDIPDREALQAEMNHLGAEIDRIADTANFNGNKLFSPKEFEETRIIHHRTPRNNYVNNTCYIKTPINQSMYVSLGSNTKCPGAVEAEKGDTLKVIGEAIGKFMLGPPVLTDMDGTKKVYYTKDGKAWVGDNNASSAAVKSGLGLSAGDTQQILSVQTDTKYYVEDYSGRWDAVGLVPEKLVKGDTTGDTTLGILKKAATDFMNKYKGKYGTGLEALDGGKKFYYSKDGKNVVIGKNGKDEDGKDITDTVGSNYYEVGISVSLPHTSKNTKINNSYLDHYDEHDERKTEKVYRILPITLQVGETSGKPDKLPVSLFDIHTDVLFEAEVVNKPVTRPNLSLGGGEGTANGYDNQIIIGYKQVLDYDKATRALVGNDDVSAYNKAVTLDVAVQDSALKNVEFPRKVTDKISLIRGYYGAVENRLDYTINNHENTVENVSRAKSRIKDTDMAKEMSEYTKNNILAQTARAMLAQANVRPQDVLQLIQ